MNYPGFTGSTIISEAVLRSYVVSKVLVIESSHKSEKYKSKGIVYGFMQR